MTNTHRWKRRTDKLLALFRDKRTPPNERENAHRRLIEMIKVNAESLRQAIMPSVK